MSEKNYGRSSRFDSLSRFWAAIVLALLGLLIALGLLVGAARVPNTEHLPDSKTDTALYTAIVSRVQGGESYYSAAISEQIERNFPVRPATTVREPTLAYGIALVGGTSGARIVLLTLAGVAGLAMLLKLEQLSRNRITWWVGAVLTAFSSVAVFATRYTVLHEVWASLFLVLALLARRPGKSALPSVLFGLLAVAIREIAFPFIVVMAFFAWREGKARECWQWVCAALVFLIGYAVHCSLVVAHTTSADPHSPGWVKVGGWPFGLSTVRETTLLSLAPWWVTAIVVPLSLLGWASIRNEFAVRIFATLVTFLTIFAVIGRPENWYWGILYVPLIGAGVAFAPSAIWSLVQRTRFVPVESSHP